MHTSLRAFGVVLALVGVVSCSRQQSIGGGTASGTQRVYALTETEAAAIAHGAIVSSFPGRRIETIDGPVRGYSTYTRMLLDTFTQQVLIRPVTGRRADGSTVEGYTFEVSGSGTAGISGGIANANFGSTLQSAADSTGKAVDVVSIAPRAVSSSRPVAGADASGAPQRLRALRDLLDQGLISAAEYETKRRQILGSL